jgi:hypothetical protein
MLESLGLAEKVWIRTWRLSPQLEDAFRQAQLSRNIIKPRARHHRLSEPRVPVTLTRIGAGTVITGRVVGTGLADELRDRFRPPALHPAAVRAAVDIPERRRSPAMARLR